MIVNVVTSPADTGIAVSKETAGNTWSSVVHAVAMPTSAQKAKNDSFHDFNDFYVI